MSRYNFKGDLDQITERQLAYVEEILEKNGVKGQDVTIEPVGAAGDNYIANVKRIITQKNGEEFRMIAKLAATDPKTRFATNMDLMFYNEHVIYTEVMPKFKQIQEEAGLKDDLFRYPICYGSLSEQPNEIILLEDLKVSNFVNLDRFKSLSNECVKITLKNLAKFHSLSFALKSQDMESYSAMKTKLRDLFSAALSKIEQTKVYFTQIEKMALGVLQDNKLKATIKGSIGELCELATKCFEADKDCKYSIIRQGDGWTNNIMFRMEGDLPKECILIDYQLACECTPVHDIMYMLFNSTNHEQRHNHYHEFINFYHSQLDASLKNYGLKASDVYPREQLDIDLKRYAKYAMALSLLISSVIVQKSEEATKMKEAMKSENMAEMAQNQAQQINPETLMLFKKRVEDLAQSFIEFGLL